MKGLHPNRVKRSIRPSRFSEPSDETEQRPRPDIVPFDIAGTHCLDGSSSLTAFRMVKLQSADVRERPRSLSPAKLPGTRPYQHRVRAPAVRPGLLRCRLGLQQIPYGRHDRTERAEPAGPAVEPVPPVAAVSLRNVANSPRTQ
ncbi:hypothetical protein GCM10020221_21370 [Streptomyces thioluteus]|uniref:Uncharacterized protein n=1 Tax=Streptomyces thioluteus TaxID=66431 RepID=A0ABN3WSA3_STRTU